MFSIRAVTLDYYMSKTVAELESAERNKHNRQGLEPVIRIFGSTPNGVKSCVHVHGVYPYIYVPYKGGENPDRESLLLSAALDEALKITLHQNNGRFVYKAVVVSGMPLYGYHSQCRQFFKIFFYNPFYITKASDLLLNGAVLGQKFQPHEAHIPFILQFMMDFNIYGMSIVTFSRIKYRRNPENPASLAGIKEEVILPDSVKRMTCCYFEVDVLSVDIVNEKSDKAVYTNPGLQALWIREKIRRRNQNKVSQIFATESQSRQNVDMHPTEVMHKERLAMKLREIFTENVGSNDTALSYPANISASKSLLEATILNEDTSCSLDDIEDVSDISLFINDKVLSEISASENEKSRYRNYHEEAAYYYEGAEADSILGKREEEEEDEEAEPGADDGGDMTQPLEFEEDSPHDFNTERNEQGSGSGVCEKKFWQNMARKIFQIDGAQDSSSDSEVGTHFAAKTNYSDEKDYRINSVPCPHDFSSESVSSILSELNAENSSDPASAASQSSTAFWPNFSPRVDGSWLVQNHEIWSWDKNDSTFPDYFTFKSHNASDSSFITNKSLENVDSTEIYGNSLTCSHAPENFTSTAPLLVPARNTDSNYSNSSAAPDPVHNSRADASLDSGSNPTKSVSCGVLQCYSQLEEGQIALEGRGLFVPQSHCTLHKRKANFEEKIQNESSTNNAIKKSMPDTEQNKAVSMTLKQYLKDFGEIVNVDLKNFADQEMVVVEYKPVDVRSRQSKFLIKPLDKFLENWNIAEKKMNYELLERSLSSCEWQSDGVRSAKEFTQKKKRPDPIHSPSSVNVNSFKNIPEKEKLKNSKVKSVDNKSFFKSVQVLPGKCSNKKMLERTSETIKRTKIALEHSSESSVKNRKKNLNEECDMLTKSFVGQTDCANSEKGSVHNDIFAGLCVPREGNAFDQTTEHDGKKPLNNAFGCHVQSKKKGSGLEKEPNCRSEPWENSRPITGGKDLSEGDGELINEINSCFENYFKNIIKVNNSNIENSSNIFEKDMTNCESSLKEDIADVKKNDNSKTEQSKNDELEHGYRSSNLESVKFVAQLLSTFSQMSRTCKIPPLSITINIGKEDNSALVPVQLNLRPSVTTNHERNPRDKTTKLRKKIKIQNVDGPADNSSSEDSLEFSVKQLTPSKRNVKKADPCDSLNAVCRKTFHEKYVQKKKKRKTKCPELSSEGNRTCGTYPTSIRRDWFIDGSKITLNDEKETSKGSNSRSDTVGRVERSFENSLLRQDSNESKSQERKIFGKKTSEAKSREEEDFICDSEEDKKPRDCMSKKRKKQLTEIKFKKKVGTAENFIVSTDSDDEMGWECNGPHKNKFSPAKNTTPVTIKELGTKKKVSESICADSSVCRDDVNYRRDGLPGESAKSSEKDYSLNLSKCEEVGFGVHKFLRENSRMMFRVTTKRTFLKSPLSLDEENISSMDSKEIFEVTAKSSALVESSPNGANNSFVFDSTVTSVKNLDETAVATALTPEESLVGHQVLHLSVEAKEYSPSSSGFPTPDLNDHKLNSIASLNGSMTIIPSLKPPTSYQVRQFLVVNENFKNVAEVPFYGDPSDVTRGLETGPLTLKVEGRDVSVLKSLKSDLDFLGAEERRARALIAVRHQNEKHRWSMVPEDDVVITPLSKPPFFSAATARMEFKKIEFADDSREIRSKGRVALPLSSDEESVLGEELAMSLALSTLKENDNDSSLKNHLQSRPENDFGGSQNFPVTDSVLTSKEIQRKKTLHSPCDNMVRMSEKSKSSNLFRDDVFPNEIQSRADNSFQIKGKTLENTFGFDESVRKMDESNCDRPNEFLTMMVMEVHVRTRKEFHPDPQYDPIRALFYTVTIDNSSQHDETGIIVVGDASLLRKVDSNKKIHYVSSEKKLILKLVEIMKIWDPDIVAGYEIEKHSWGYLVQRGSVLELNLFSLLGRLRTECHSPVDKSESASRSDLFEDVPNSVRNLKLLGRIVLDVWRVLRHEVSLTSYTFENAAYHICHERHPLISYKCLSLYWEHERQTFRHIAVDYYLTRVLGVVKLLDRLDFINRTSELAKLYGIQFYEVLSRGSQFRVESMMLRVAKPLNYIATSPSVTQRAAMRAPSSLPLILEPESHFYTDPVIVLDFQSLYPSMIIAYNYCFSTCVGRLENLGRREPFEFGCTQLQISPEELKELENDISISPAAVVFVKPNIRKGILPKMLEKILEARLMVKKSMKENKDDRHLQKVLYSRQLGLKLIANVTYGYTAANFSGRMPCVEVGDSIVSKGRETLHRAIQMVNNNSKWGARVVYGDTDSIFVLLPGKSREEAFLIGTEIAEAVTQDNPKPVKLKLEKVYHPCILQTKKRYVGYSYETAEQIKPIFEAKGIETVRRDGCPAVRKILQKALEILFDTRDVSLIKKYTVRQFAKLLQGRVNVQDLIFAKEYRGRNGYRPGACVPALQLAREWTRFDKRAEPRVKERVPYVVVNGPPGVPLIKLVRSPTDLIADPSLYINSVYYIKKVIIPPMQRCFSLLGVDVASWYLEVPQKRYNREPKAWGIKGQKKSTISQYFPTVLCILCSQVADSFICIECHRKPQALTVGVMEKIRLRDRCHSSIVKICQACCRGAPESVCRSIDCPVLFRRSQASRDLLQIPILREMLEGRTSRSHSILN